MLAIGEIVEYDGVNLECVDELHGCVNCYFFDDIHIECNSPDFDKFACTKGARGGEAFVKFKEVTKCNLTT